MGNGLLIYVKNYQELNELVNQNSTLSFRRQLSDLIGKPVTVFVDSGGASGNGFTGVLIEVFADRIKLITSLSRCAKCTAGFPCPSKGCDAFGTGTTVMLNHITAINYNFI